MPAREEDRSRKRSEIRERVSRAHVSQLTKRGGLSSFLSFTFFFFPSLGCARLSRKRRAKLHAGNARSRSTIASRVSRGESARTFARREARFLRVSLRSWWELPRERNRMSLRLRITRAMPVAHVTDSKVTRTETRNDYERECEILYIYAPAVTFEIRCDVKSRGIRFFFFSTSCNPLRWEFWNKLFVRHWVHVLSNCKNRINRSDISFPRVTPGAECLRTALNCPQCCACAVIRVTYLRELQYRRDSSELCTLLVHRKN